MNFYVRRDTQPQEWYPASANGSILKFNDLLAEYRNNVNTTEVPYNRKPGMNAALNADEVADLVRFLGTLNDGYKN